MIQETIEQIENRLMTKLKATPPFDTIDMSPSAVAMWSNFLNTIATEIFTLQQLMNTNETAVETNVALAPPAIAQWLQNKVFLFQSGDILQLDTTAFTASYPTVDATHRIVTQCSVITDSNKNVQVKVAKNSPPEKFSALELADLQSYIDIVEPSGLEATAVSLDPDRLFIEAEIFYNGQYSSVIQTNVIEALNTFLASFAGVNFNGVVKLSALENAILSVPGVTDVEFNNVRARDSGTALVDAQYLVQANTQIGRFWQTVAGYIIGEDGSGNTFADKLTFTAE